MRLGTFHLALEALGLGASTGARQAQDLLVVVHQRVEQFLAEYSRLLRLEHLQYHALIAEGLCVAGVRMKQCFGVANETGDVTNSLGGHVECRLVVGRLEGREFTLQERVNHTVLAWNDLKTLHCLATSESTE